MNQQDHDNKDHWWESFYDDLLVDVLLDQTSTDDIERTVDFLVGVLDLKLGLRVFDQCCGTGRLALALMHRGINVTGVDLGKDYAAKARERSEREGIGALGDFHEGDAFSFVAAESCHAAINWWTSFGYAADDETNAQMLDRAYESLKPSGVFALDFMNVPGLYRHFQKAVVTRVPGPCGEMMLVRESKIDLAGGLIRKRWTYFQEGKTSVEYDTCVRLYEPVTLKRLFHEAGFVGIEIYGDLDASPIQIDSPRCIVVGRKPSEP